jgi:hypothetical protein
MKTPFLIAVALLLGYQFAISQIPNAGFEDWIESNGYFNPAGWWCANDSVQAGAAYPANRTSDHFPPNSGSYAIRIENNIELLPSWAALGIIWTGGLAGNDNPVFALQGHPVELYGYYKFLPLNGDTFEIHIRLYNGGIDVGGGQFKTAEMTNSWQPFSIDISDYETADSARIMILACYNNDAPNPAGNSTLFIDNLSFDSLVIDGTIWQKETAQLTVWPNPATNFISIAVKQNSEESLCLISDLQGREVMRVRLLGSETKINTSALPAGPYLVRIVSANAVSKSIFIKRPM